jgi:hypothetical protein
MPKPARFQSETAQKTAVGIVTFIVLCVAVGIAQLYTQAHQTSNEVVLESGRIDALTLDLPRGWARQTMQDNEAGFTGRAMTLRDQARELTVGRIDIVAPQGPGEVLARVLGSVTGDRRGGLVNPSAPRRFRAGPAACVISHGERQIEKDGPVVYDWVVVMTEDGRRHWVMLLRVAFTTDDSVRRYSERLILRIAASARDTAFRPADPGFLDPARLGADGDDAVMAPRLDTSIADAPIHVPLSDPSQAHLGLLRLRRCIDPGPAQPPAPLSPAAGLRREFQQLHGRDPDAAELTTAALNGATVTRVRLNDGTNGELVRELHYIDGQEGLLVEVLAEPEALDATLAMIAPIHRAVQSAGGPALLGEINDAIKRGRALASAQRRLTTTLFGPDQRYYRVLREGHVVGTIMEESYHRPESEMPLRVRAVRVQTPGRGTIVSETRSHSSPDGQRVDQTVYSEVSDGLTSKALAYQLVLRDGVLALSMLPPAAGREAVWSQREPEGFIAGLAESRWVWHELEAFTASGPVLIWRCRGAEQPEPQWLEVRRGGRRPPGEAGQAYNLEPAGAVALVTIRPMMGMDAQCYWLDAQGRVLRAQWFDAARSSTGGARMTAEPADAAAVVAIYPKNRDILRLWQQEGLRDD